MEERLSAPINVRLPERLKAKLEREAQTAGVPLSELIRVRLEDSSTALTFKDGKVTSEELKNVIAKAIVEVQRKSR